MDVLRGTVSIDADGPALQTTDRPHNDGRIVILRIGELDIMFRGWSGPADLCKSLDRVLEPLVELRKAAGARLVDEIVADLAAHPLGDAA